MTNLNIKKTKFNLFLSGDELEIYEFEKPVYYDYSSERGSIKMSNVLDTRDSRSRSRNRARKNVKRLINSNFGKWIDSFGRPFYSKFLTLTFKADVYDPAEGNPLFTLFMKRLNYKLFKIKKGIIKYLMVIEFMPKSKKVHYHVVLFNLPFIDNFYYVFKEAWGLGHIWIKRVPNIGVGNYIAKYMTKDDDEKLKQRKSYSCSRNLIKPLNLRDEEFISTLITSIPNNIEKHSFTYNAEHTGKTTWTGYNLSDYSALKDLIFAYKSKSDKVKIIK